jgi:DNA-binding response OmpR family regulator
VERWLFLTDRALGEALPAASGLGPDVKVEPLDGESLSHLAQIAPTILVVDAEEDAERAHRLLSALPAAARSTPVLVVVSRADLGRFAWAEVADEFVHPSVSAEELRLRVAMLVRRTGGAGDSVLRLGPLTINVDTYSVAVTGRILDLTYKEFELLRFLVSSPGRVFTRSELLSKVWGYDFYGGTRTVDVHVRRLRAKLGPEHEALIETVRGVGYRATEPHTPDED